LVVVVCFFDDFLLFEVDVFIEFGDEEVLCCVFEFELVLNVEVLWLWFLCFELIVVLLFVDVLVELSMLGGMIEGVCDVVEYLECMLGALGGLLLFVCVFGLLGFGGVSCSLLNVLIGLYWCFVWVEGDFGWFKEIKMVFGGIVNDVVFIVVMGVLCEHLICCGNDVSEFEFKVMVFVLVCVEVECGALGNCVIMMYVLFFVYE